MKSSFFRIKVVAVLAVVYLFMSAAQAERNPSSALLDEVSDLKQEVEQIRLHMGAPYIPRLYLTISDAQIHDVYFLAQTFHEKSNRLLFQVTRKRSTPSQENSAFSDAADVSLILQESKRNLELVRTALGIPEQSRRTSRSSKDQERLSTVFLEIMAVNRQINSLLDRKFAPSDVYQQVTKAISYSSILLSEYPDTVGIPKPSAFEPRKAPQDVFVRLLDTLKMITKLYLNLGLDSLNVDVHATSLDDINPSDVVDIAALVVARLDFLHQSKEIDITPREPYYPGNVYPSDVYQRASILLKQLDSLVALSHAADQ